MSRPPGPNSDDFTIATIRDRITRFGDLFDPLLDGSQPLEAAEEALRS